MTAFAPFADAAFPPLGDALSPMAFAAPTDAPAAGPAPEAGACDAVFDDAGNQGYVKALRIAAVFIIFTISGLGIALPYLSRKLKGISQETPAFFVLKCFGAGVILATGLIHMFPDASEALGGSEAAQQCLGWADYPWAAMIATVSVIAVMVVDTMVSKFFYRLSIVKAMDAPGGAPGGYPPAAAAPAEKGAAPTPSCLEEGARHAPHKQLPTPEAVELARKIAIAQVLEAGIAFHSVIIGIAIGASTQLDTVRPLIAALAFHQFFEGIALGACLIEAGFKRFWYAAFALCFALTCPIGVAIGLGITSTYNENSATALAVQGIFDSISAGILIYTALVDLVATDIFSPRALASTRLQVAGQVAIFGGAVVMGIIAIWA